MNLAQSAFGLEVAEWAIIIGAIFFAFEVSGLSRSSRTLRPENADLRERNATLEGETKARAEKLVALERERDDLKTRQVDALLIVMRDHDERMSRAATGMTESLVGLAAEIASHEERAATRHGKTLALLEEMTVSLKAGQAR